MKTLPNFQIRRERTGNDFLNALFPEKGIADLSYMKTEYKALRKDEKSVIFDVACRTENRQAGWKKRPGSRNKAAGRRFSEGRKIIGRYSDAGYARTRAVGVRRIRPGKKDGGWKGTERVEEDDRRKRTAGEKRRRKEENGEGESPEGKG